MPLAHDIRSLRDRALADLNTAHDYYTDTKVAWGIVEDVVAAGRAFANMSAVTGTMTTATELANKADKYIAVQLAESTFQQFVSIFESFLFDLLRLWLLAYPRSLGEKTVAFKAILDAPDKDAIALMVVNKELNEVLYERPANWFAYLEDRAKLGCPTAAEIEQFTEAKASRDVLVHNRGVVPKSYAAKAGKLGRYKEGERMDIPEDYHRAIWQLFCKIVADVADASVGKVV